MERKGLSLCTIYAPLKSDLFISHCVQSLYTHEKVQNLCLCCWLSLCFSRCVLVHAHTLCLCVRVCLWATLAQTVLCRPWFSAQTQAQWLTWKAMRYLRDTSSLFDLVPGNGMKFSAVVFRDKSLRRGLGWKAAFRQQMTVCSKLNYWTWVKVANYIELYWSTTLQYFYFFFPCIVNLYRLMF